MKKKWEALLLCVFIFLTLACSLFSSSQRQFDASAFSFSYPRAWQPMAELWPNYQSDRDYYGLGVQEIVMVTSARRQGQTGVYFAVASAPLPEGLSLENMYRQTYDPLMDELRDVSEGAAMVDGLSGFEINYQRPWGEPWWRFRDLWFEKDGVIYVLSFHALPGVFDDHQEEFTEILDSFSFP